MTAESPFAPPAAASGIQWESLSGRLLVIEPHALERDIATILGAKDAVRADVHVIDQDEPETHEDTLIFPRVLISQLRPRIGQMVLGRLEQGNAKPGQTAPWRIAEATSQDQALGGDWLRKRKTFTAPAPDTGRPPF